MHIDVLRSCLESFEQARPVLHLWGVRDPERGWRNLAHLAEALGLDSLRKLTRPLGRFLRQSPDPDMALNNVERFLAQPAGAAQLPTLLEGRARVLETVVQLFATSQYFSDLLYAYPDYLEMLRVPLRRSPSVEELQKQLLGEVDAAFEDSAVLRAFRRFRQRQILRIGTNDIIRDRPFEEITRDISRVADTALDVALTVALRRIGARFGEPCTAGGQPARCVILAFGKLGGEELNYSSDIDLMFLYDEEGTTRSRRVSSIDNGEFYGRVVSEVVKLLSAHSDMGQAYRIDLRLRPEGHRGALARSLASTLSYYDTLGRTWERQALIKVRPVAGDLELGEQFLRSIEPFVYRKYLSYAEINEIKALKRRIEQKTGQAGDTDREVKTGRGGIRDIEFTIQFLQLLNGGDLPEVRERNTLLAMQALDEVGCLTDQEYGILDSAYRFLRKTEHRLQLLFDLQTHRLPDKSDELAKLARRMGYTGAERPSWHGVPRSGPLEPLDAFQTDYREKTDLTRKILDHLLHGTFEGSESQESEEADLILHSNPDPETIQAVLGRYPFRDVPGAYNNLMLLAQESVPFLSTRRCRHFLASIAPQLLRAVADTPDPDLALVNLEKVTASVGAKAVLWELFSFNPPSLGLYVDICASSQFLSDILINNPGMIDDLLDSLVLNQPRTAEELRAELTDLCKGAADPDPILHSFQDKELLRIGVRDILGKDTIQQTTAALSDLAETILAQTARQQEPTMQRRFGAPMLGDRDAESQGRGDTANQHAAGSPCRRVAPSRFVLIGLGKLGGKEMGYQSDLDLMLVYEGDGRTSALPGSTKWDRFELTDNFHYFTELMQRIIKVMSVLGPLGRLYQVDMRLRPTGRSGSLVIPLAEFRRYYEEGGAQLWERQTLTRGRLVYGDPAFGREVMGAVDEAAFGQPWRPEIADEILSMRQRLEASRSERDLKRGFGGIVDIEFLVQLYQLKYAKERPAIRSGNTWEALAALAADGLIQAVEQTALQASYDFLRQVESALRILHNRSLDELPEAPEEVEKLARRVGMQAGPGGSAGAQLLAEVERHTTQTRELFLQLIQRERGE